MGRITTDNLIRHIARMVTPTQVIICTSTLTATEDAGNANDFSITNLRRRKRMVNATKKYGSLTEALAAFQADAPRVDMDAINPHFKSKFATLANMSTIVLPKLSEHGLAFSTGAFVENGVMILDAHLMHESGTSRSMQFPITETNPQKVGSAISYYRRYALASLTGVVADGDDDGNAASQPSAAERAIANAAPKPPQPTNQASVPASGRGELAEANDRIRVWIDGDATRKKEVNDRIEELKKEGSSALKARETVIAEKKIPELKKV
jgi:hypothetical protein